MIANRWPFTPPTPEFFSIICENQCYLNQNNRGRTKDNVFPSNKRRLVKKSENLNKYGPFFIIFPLPVMLIFTVHFTAVHLFTCVAKAVTSRRSREYMQGSLDISAHNNFGSCQFRPITKSAYTISAHRYNKVFIANWHN